jgi:hypothetical protein
MGGWTGCEASFFHKKVYEKSLKSSGGKERVFLV